MPITLEDLRAFTAVCETGSLSAAARRLGCTQPAVSQHVARLERELGVTLVERGRRGATATSAGRILRDAGAASLGALASGVREIARLRDGERGELTIATGGTTVRHFMRDATRRFLADHPGVALRFEPGASSSECIERLRAHGADLAFITCLDEPVGLEQRAVLEMQSRLIVASDDPLAKRRRITLRDLAGIRHVSLPPSTTSARQIQHLLAQQGVVPAVAATVDDFDTANAFVEAGLGHAIVPVVQALAFARTRRVAAIPISGLPPFRVGWAARSFEGLAPPGVRFMAAFERATGRWRNTAGVRILLASGRGPQRAGASGRRGGAVPI